MKPLFLASQTIRFPNKFAIVACSSSFKASSSVANEPLKKDSFICTSKSPSLRVFPRRSASHTATNVSFPYLITLTYTRSIDGRDVHQP